MIIHKDFETKLQDLKSAITEHNEDRKWWQPEWRLNESFLFFSIYYNGFPNPLKIHRTMYGLSWSAFPKGYHALLKPKELQW